ncbi:hypothetical protein [Sphingomonas japonica]|uniref:Uncharacterized protein n=1 Tax=Sphingomonas japonica TaxID=511662 RepID=A0ABX0U770_9SPHN|nr:hypothetical protein [Sphingomonas japonica]NIJ25177.1 hypothetical protein [Sphingomonas japonica]
MRNALICVAVMAALLLLWPLAFGTHGGGRVDAATVRIAVPPVAR